MKEKKDLIPEVNIGIVGHVDHGKTTLNQAITGKWTDTHSEEIKRGITIRLGYADAVFYYCNKCMKYSNAPKCSSCFESAEPKRAVSFVDAPGHETLMATVLSGAALMDGALLVIAANEKCPQPQTAEHLKALDIVGIRKIIIVQNKVDLVSEERALESYEEIKKFVKGTVAENAPVIPVSAINNANIDALIDAIEQFMPTPERNLGDDPRFYVARSFDVNKPGTDIEQLEGGVAGGSLTEGVLRVNQEIEIRPGVQVSGKWTPMRTKITEIVESGQQLQEAKPGGLVALQTELDPAITRGDGIVGNIIGLPEKLPPVHEEIKLNVELFSYVIGVEGQQKVSPPKTGDALLITVAIAKTVGAVTSAGGKTVQLKLKLPVCADKGDKVAIAAQVGGRWHLIGYGVIA
ncbi:MAG: translation initiation factor IF-2 subunit gamma [Candidatus Aenigmarchaeota archaeon]|nr:translation initiation factor IF-2 subunit gamma [Candidatus Aenigmarchaeota archaeon]